MIRLRQTLANKLRTWWLPLVLAMLVGVIYVLPHVLFIADLGTDYQGIILMGADAEEYYAARVREIYDGHYTVSNAFLHEHKSAPYMQPPLPELLLGLAGKLGGLSMGELFIAADFVLPAVMFLLAYGLMLLLTGSRAASVLGASLLVLGHHLFSFELPASLRFVLTGDRPRVPLIFSRPVNPQLNLLFFFGCLIFLYRAVRDEEWRDVVLAGAFLGVQFYTYPYCWTFLYVGGGILFAVALLRKEYGLCKRLAVVGGIGAVVSVPFWINLAVAVHLPAGAYAEYSHRQGMIASRAPTISRQLLVSIPLFALLYRPRDRRYWFLLSLLIGGFVVLNQNVITGRHLQSGHWHWYTNKPTVIIALAVLLHYFFSVQGWGARLRSWLRSWVGALAVGLVVAFLVGEALFVQLSALNAVGNRYAGYQTWGGAFAWLNANSPPDSVVLAADEPMGYLAVYTHNNLYHYEMSKYYVLDDAELWSRQLRALRFWGLSEVEVAAYIDRYSDHFFGMYYRELYGNYLVPPEKMERLLTEYRNYLDANIGDVLHAYRIDYVFYGPYEEEQFGDLPDYPDLLSEVYADQYVRIMSVY